MKQTFINKWSCWWTLNRQGKQLTKAFEKELDELVSGKGGEITKDALLERGFKEVMERNGNYFKLKVNRFDDFIYFDNGEVGIVIDVINAITDLPNCRTLPQLDTLIEMFKTR